MSSLASLDYDGYKVVRPVYSTVARLIGNDKPPTRISDQRMQNRGTFRSGKLRPAAKLTDGRNDRLPRDGGHELFDVFRPQNGRAVVFTSTVATKACPDQPLVRLQRPLSIRRRSFGDFAHISQLELFG